MTILSAKTPDCCDNLSLSREYEIEQRGNVMFGSQLKVSSSPAQVDATADQINGWNGGIGYGIWFRFDIVNDWPSHFSDNMCASGPIEELDAKILRNAKHSVRLYRFPGMDADVRGGFIPIQKDKRERWGRYHQLQLRLGTKGRYPITFRKSEVHLDPRTSWMQMAHWTFAMAKRMPKVTWWMISGHKPLHQYNGTVEYTIQERNQSVAMYLAAVVHNLPDHHFIVMDSDMKKWLPNIVPTLKSPNVYQYGGRIDD